MSNLGGNFAPLFHLAVILTGTGDHAAGYQPCWIKICLTWGSQSHWAPMLLCYMSHLFYFENAGMLSKTTDQRHAAVVWFCVKKQSECNDGSSSRCWCLTEQHKLSTWRRCSSSSIDQISCYLVQSLHETSASLCNLHLFQRAWIHVNRGHMSSMSTTRPCLGMSENRPSTHRNTLLWWWRCGISFITLSQHGAAAVDWSFQLCCLNKCWL